jgi:hypothetical protein
MKTCAQIAAEVRPRHFPFANSGLLPQRILAAMIVEAIEADRAQRVGWEYGIRAEGDAEPYSDVSEDFDWLLDDGGGGTMLTEPGTHVVRRRRAGDWERVPVHADGTLEGGGA